MKLEQLSSQEIIRTWETGEGRQGWFKALAILARGQSLGESSSLEELTIGRRNAYLVVLRRSCFGDIIESFANCPACDQKVSFSVNTIDISAAAPATGEQHEFTHTIDKVELSFRLIDSRDLAVVGDIPDVRQLRRKLLERAITTARVKKRGRRKKINPIELMEREDSFFNEWMEKMVEEYDPLFELRLALDCPSCNHHWTVVFDIAAFFWAEIKQRAQSLLNEVHILAKAYHWSEQDILMMSDARRQYYLEKQHQANNPGSSRRRQS